MRPLHLVSFLAVSCLLSGCISLSVPSSAGKKARDVAFTTPAPGFQALNDTIADKAWVNDRTGNTVSFISDCESKADPALPQMQSDALSVLNELRIDEEKKIPFNGREALSAVASGTMDGVAVRMKVITLKKNACNYTLSYTGVTKSFDADLPAFDGFVNGFKAP